MNIKVLPSALKHGISTAEILFAWTHLTVCIERDGNDDPWRYLAIGVLPNGNFVEMIAFQQNSGVWCVFHAMTPPARKFLNEINQQKRRLK